jgi:hypothetical protein
MTAPVSIGLLHLEAAAADLLFIAHPVTGMKKS